MIQVNDNGSHPDLDRWLAYRAGDLGREDEGTLQDHLVDCRSCTALVLDLEAFADPPASERAAKVSELEKAAVWRGLRPRLQQPAATGRIADRPQSAMRRWYVPTTLAASFLAAVLGAGLWLQQRQLSGLRDQLAAFSQPQANAPVYDLYPRAVLRGGPEPGPGATLEIPAAAPAFTLILNRAEPGELGPCRAEIVDPRGRRWVVVDGLEMDELGVFTFALARGTVAAGDYVVRLWETAGETLVEEYPLRIVFR